MHAVLRNASTAAEIEKALNASLPAGTLAAFQAAAGRRRALAAAAEGGSAGPPPVCEGPVQSVWKVSAGGWSPRINHLT